MTLRERVARALTRTRSLRLHRDVDDLILSRVGQSETASYTTALEDLVRDSREYQQVSDMGPGEYETLVRRGDRIVKENKRRPGSDPERKRKLEKGAHP